jgi:SPP1 gp7 family putative phage head morphogenesis protein
MLKNKKFSQAKIALAMKSARARSKGKKLKLRKSPRPQFPRNAMLAYYRDLKKIIAYMKVLQSDIVLPRVALLFATANKDKPLKIKGEKDSRQDSFVTDLKQMLEAYKLKFQMKYSSEDIESVAKQNAKRIADENGRQIDKITKAVLGVDVFRNEPWLKEQMEIFTTNNVNLIESIPYQYLDKVQSVVTRGVNLGWTSTETAKEIEHQFDVSSNRAKLIARDQTAKFNCSLMMLRQTEVGVEKYQWSTSKDERVRDSHRENDGKIFNWDDAPSETGHPGDDINCRCVAIPIFTEESFNI